MKQETKKWVERGVIWFSPIFTLIMFLLPWMGYYKESTSGVYTIGEKKELYSFFKLLTFDTNVFTTIIMSISLIGVVASIVLYVLSISINNKEKLFAKIAAIVLVCSTGILFLSTLGENFKTEILTGTYLHKWVDFMFFPYAFLMIYNVGALIYIVKKMFK